VKIRQTLNNLTPRTLREARRDPYDWWRASPRPDTRGEQIAGVALAVVIGIVLTAALLHWWAA